MVLSNGTLPYHCPHEYYQTASLAGPVRYCTPPYRVAGHFPNTVSNLDPHKQRLLLPQDPGLLTFPIPGPVHRLEIKIPEEVSQDQSHLEVGEVAAQTVSWAERERVECRCGAGFGGGSGCRQPARGIERGGGSGEVKTRTVGGIARAGYECLMGLSDCLLRVGGNYEGIGNLDLRRREASGRRLQHRCWAPREACRGQLGDTSGDLLQ
jgi:hypothetical protein